jgi:hypothetical protein
MNYIGSPLPAHSSEGSVAHARGRAQSRDGRRDDVHDKLEYGLPGFFFHGKGCFKVQGSKVQSSRFKVQGSRFRFQVIVFVIVFVLNYPCFSYCKGTKYFSFLQGFSDFIFDLF